MRLAVHLVNNTTGLATKSDEVFLKSMLISLLNANILYMDKLAGLELGHCKKSGYARMVSL